jgi:hypothetical protein
MKKAVYLSCLLGLSFLSSCIDEDDDFYKLKKVKTGMTIKEVNNIMGAPDSIFVEQYNDGSSRLKFRYDATSILASDDMYIHFALPDSTVIYINNGN